MWVPRLEEQDAEAKDLFQRFDSRLAEAAAAAQVLATDLSSKFVCACPVLGTPEWRVSHASEPACACLVVFLDVHNANAIGDKQLGMRDQRSGQCWQASRRWEELVHAGGKR